MNIQLIAALGNNDQKYDHTRHNIGFKWINQLANRNQLTWQKASFSTGQITKMTDASQNSIILFKPGLLMNINGEPIAKCAKYYKIPPENILLVYDDLDLGTGIVKLKKSSGHGGHNGIRDLQRYLDISRIVRLKIGINKPEYKDMTSRYVLQQPSANEAELLNKSINYSIDHIGLLFSNHDNEYYEKLANLNKKESQDGV